MNNIINKVRGLLVFAARIIDRVTFHKLGDMIREMTNINTSCYWDKSYAKFKDSWRDFPYEFLTDFLPKETGFSLLDIGCGLGDGCRLLKSRFPQAEIEGADFSGLAIKKAKEADNKINYFVLDIKKETPSRKYNYISFLSILEHFNNPFIVVDKCLKYVDTGVLIVSPYTERFYSPRLYFSGEHRYLFNEHTFVKYRCIILKITDKIPATGYRYIVYKIEPRDKGGVNSK